MIRPGIYLLVYEAGRTWLDGVEQRKSETRDLLIATVRRGLRGRLPKRIKVKGILDSRAEGLTFTRAALSGGAR